MVERHSPNFLATLKWNAGGNVEITYHNCCFMHSRFLNYAQNAPKRLFDLGCAYYTPMILYLDLRSRDEKRGNGGNETIVKEIKEIKKRRRKGKERKGGR